MSKRKIVCKNLTPPLGSPQSEFCNYEPKYIHNVALSPEVFAENFIQIIILNVFIVESEPSKTTAVAVA